MILQNKRHLCFKRAAEETREHGKPQGRTSFDLRNCEKQIREFNSLAEEVGLQGIR